MIIHDDGEFRITYDTDEKVLNFTWDENSPINEILKDWTEEDFYNFFHTKSETGSLSLEEISQELGSEQ